MPAIVNKMLVRIDLGFEKVPVGEHIDKRIEIFRQLARAFVWGALDFGLDACELARIRFLIPQKAHMKLRRVVPAEYLVHAPKIQGAKLTQRHAQTVSVLRRATHIRFRPEGQLYPRAEQHAACDRETTRSGRDMFRKVYLGHVETVRKHLDTAIGAAPLVLGKGKHKQVVLDTPKGHQQTSIGSIGPKTRPVGFRPAPAWSADLVDDGTLPQVVLFLRLGGLERLGKRPKSILGESALGLTFGRASSTARRERVGAAGRFPLPA